jgi:hypothetical protein
MEEMQNEVAGFVFKLLAKLVYPWLSDLRERRTGLIVLEIPRPFSPPKKPKKHPKKKARPKSPPPSQHGRFCPECGQERR